MNSFVKISITGRNPKLYFKRMFKNINYSNYKELNHKTIIAKVSYEDYLYLVEQKSIYEIKIIKYYGFKKYKNIIKENIPLLISFFVASIFLIIISNITFEIEIIHNDHNVRKLIKEELEENRIKTFFLIPSYKKRTEVKNKILKDNKDKIEWLEIERTGSKLTIKVTERRMNKNEEAIKNRHIIAKKSGIIMKIEASTGVIMKKKNDYVTKGDIIISGDIIKDETVKGQVPAKGVVYAETWYKVNVQYPLYYEETTYLDEVKNNYVIKIFNKLIPLKKNYKESFLEKKKTIVKERIFPLSIYKEKQRKVKVKKQKLTNSEAIKKAEKIAENKINIKLSKDEYIISKKTLNFSINDSRIVVDVFFKVCENITDYKDVDESLLNAPINEE